MDVAGPRPPSASSRSLARNITGFEIAHGFFFERTWVSFMPRVKWPETRRTKATRSRCLGPMVGLHLEDEARDLAFLPGATCRGSAGCTCGCGPVFGDAVHQLLHAERELIAEPNQIGCERALEKGRVVEGRQQVRAPSSISSAEFLSPRKGPAGDVLGQFRGRRGPRFLIDSATRKLRSARSISSSRSWIRS